MFSIKREASATKFCIYNLPIFKIKYKKNKIKYSLLNIPLYQKKNSYKKYSANLNTANFTPIEIDNSPILAQLKNTNDFLYIPNPGNMGDMLIGAATLDFFDQNNIKYHLKAQQNEKIIVYGGGGVWTADYQNYWSKKLNLFQSADKIIILPSSFHNCQKFIDALDDRYVVFCREKQSYEYLKKFNTKAQILLDHDMALRCSKEVLEKDVLISEDERRILKNINRALTGLQDFAKLLRNDCESANNYPSDMDLSSYIQGNEFSNKDFFFFAAQTMLSVVDKFNTIVTDRLHVGIASMLMGKETYLLDNSYKKLSNVFSHSCKTVKKAKIVTELPKTIKNESTKTDNFEKLYNLRRK